MKTVPTPRWIPVLALLAGCASTAGSAPVDASAYAALSCGELDRMLGEVSRELSQTAITRGRVARFNVPTWAPGGMRVRSAVVDRQTARVESLQEREHAIATTRNRNCPRS